MTDDDSAYGSAEPRRPYSLELAAAGIWLKEGTKVPVALGGGMGKVPCTVRLDANATAWLLEDGVVWLRRGDGGFYHYVDLEDEDEAAMDYEREQTLAELDEPEPTIEVGSVVVLQSGGPEMTVVDASDVQIQVSWFDGDALKSALFPLACLDVVA